MNHKESSALVSVSRLQRHIWRLLLPVFLLFSAAPAFAAGGPYTITLVSSSLTAVADNSTPDYVSFQVIDQSTGLPASGVPLSFQLYSTSGPSQFVSSDAGGIVTFYLAYGSIANIPIYVKQGGVAVTGSPYTFSFVAGPPDASTSYLSVDVPTSPPDGATADVITAHIFDAYGNAITGAAISFAISSTTVSGSPTYTPGLNGSTNASGTYTLDITSLYSGTMNFTATMNGIPITTGSPAVINFVATTPNTANPATALYVDVPSSPADGASQDVVRAHIVDVNGNPVPGATVVFTVSGGTATGTAIYSPGTLTATTNASGDAIIDIANTKVGTVSFTATVNGSSINNGAVPAVVTFVAAAPSATNSTLTTIVSPQPPDGASADVIQAHIVDANGNAVPNTTVVFTLTGGSASGTAVVTTGLTITTDASGNAVIDITNIKAGTVTFTASVGGVPIGPSGSPTVATGSFVATTPSATQSTLTAIITPNPPDGTSQDAVQAHILDANGNPVQGATVVFTVSGGSATGTAAYPSGLTGVTDVNGNVTIYITNTKSGDVSFTAAANGTTIMSGGSAATADVQFIATTPSTTASTLTTTVSPMPPDGTSADVVTAHIVDASGNPVPNVTVTFQQTGGTAAGTAVVTTGLTIVTDANGNAVIDITNTKSGSVNYQAYVGGVAIGPAGSPTTATVQFIATTPSAANSILVVDADNALDNGVATDNLHALILDVNGNPVPNTTVTFTISGGTAAGTVNPVGPTITVTTDANGLAPISFTNTAAGTVIVTASVGGTNLGSTGPNPNPATITFTTPPPVGANSTLTAITTPVPPDGTTPAVVQAHVVDASGNPVAGASVTFTLTGGSAIGGATPSSLTVTTDASGNANLDITNTISGDVTVTAVINGSPATPIGPTGSPTTADVQFVATTPNLSNSIVWVQKDNQPANGTSADKVEAIIEDDFGNPVPNITVTFTITGGTAASNVSPAGPAYTLTTDANGIATLSLTDTKAGTVIVQGSVGGTAIPDQSPFFPNPATVTFVPLSPSGPTSTLTATTTPMPPDGTSADVVTAHIVDANGNPISGATVVFTLSGGSALATATTGPLTATTDANGNATLNIYNTKSGDVTVTAVISGSPSQPVGAPTTADVVFIATTPSAANSILVTDVASSPADGTTTNQVHAVIYDINNNVVPNTTVTFTLTGGTAMGTAIPVGPVITVTTDANGIATFTVANTQPGTVIVTASVGGTNIASSGANPNPATLTFTAPPPPTPSGPNSTLTAITTPVPPDGTTPAVVRAHIVDAGGTAISGASVTITITGGSASGTASVASYTVTTDASGNADFDITNMLSGDVTVTAVVNGSTPVGAPDQATVNFVATTPDISQSVLFVIKDNQPADGTSTDKVQAVIVDANGNPVPNITVTFTITGGTAAGTVVPAGPTITVTTDANGLANLTFTNLTAGTVIVQASVGGTPLPNSGLFPNPATITFVPLAPSGPTSTLTATTTPMPPDGVSADVVTAHIVDVNGNPISGATVTFTLSGGSALATATTGPLTATTDANGNATLNIYNTKSGDVQVTAVINGTTPVGAPTTADVVFIATTPSAANSILVTDVATSPADGTTTNQVHAVIYDVNNNPVPNTTVTFTLSGTILGTATPAGPTVTVTTDANGIATFTVANSQPGTVIVTASVGGTDLASSGANPNPANLVFTTPPPAPSGPNSTITATVPTAPADGATPAVVTAHIVDATNAAMANVSVTFTITGGTAQGTVVTSTLTVLTNASGDAVLDLTNLKTGTVTVTAAINGTTPVANGATATVTFTPLAASAANSIVIKDIDNAQANGTSPDQIHAVIYDANNNVVPNTTVTFTLTGGTALGTANPTGPTITVTTDANGIATFSVTNTQPGTVIVTASVGGTDIAGTVANPNPVTLTFVPPTSTGGGTTVSTLVMDVSGSPTDNTTPDIVHANVVDGSGTGLSGETVVFTITGGTAGTTATLGTVTYLGNGNYSINITNTKVGTVILTATVNGQPILNGSSPATVTVDFVAGPPSATSGKTNLSIIVDNNVADGSSTDSVQALITDAYGNPVANTSVTFTIEAGGTAGSTAQFAQNFTVTTNAQGIASIGITNTVAGTVNIGAYIGGVAITNSPATITFVNAPDITNPNTQLIVIVYEALADGQSATQVKAHVVDQSGNPIADRKIVFSIDSGSATMISANPVYTDNNGDAVINLTSKTPGFVLITATVDGKPIVFGSPARVHFAAINIYVPRVFTPNNDGTNDVLKPILVGISQFHYFSVYNRWGNLIFTTQDPNVGWDGTFRGVPQPVETYLWIGEGIDVNGKKVVQRGMVSLVR